LPVVDGVDETADRGLDRDERVGRHVPDRLAHVVVEAAERLGGPRGFETGLALDGC
jgi:hypothetical protein